MTVRPVRRAGPGRRLLHRWVASSRLTSKPLPHSTMPSLGSGSVRYVVSFSTITAVRTGTRAAASSVTRKVASDSAAGSPRKPGANRSRTDSGLVCKPKRSGTR